MKVTEVIDLIFQRVNLEENHLSTGDLIRAQKYGCFPYYFITTQNCLSKMNLFGSFFLFTHILSIIITPSFSSFAPA